MIPYILESFDAIVYLYELILLLDRNGVNPVQVWQLSSKLDEISIVYFIGLQTFDESIH